MVKRIKRRQKNPSIKNSDYWNQLLDNFNTSVKVWIDGFDVPEKSTANKNPDQYTTQKIAFKKKNITQLNFFCKKNHIDSSILIQAAWAILLSRYSGTDDLIYGHATFSKTITTKKISVNDTVLPVRTLIHEQESVFTFIKKLAAQLKSAKQNASAFYHLIKQHSLPHLYYYLFLISQKSATKIKQLNMDPATYPLLLVVRGTKPIKIEFIYNDHRFSKKEIKNLIVHFMLILEKMITDPETDIAHFSILTPAEKRNLLSGWGQPHYPQFPALNHSTCVQHLFTASAERKPNNVAISSTQFTLTYQETDALSNQLAHFFLTKDSQPGDIIAVLMERTPALLVVMLAIFKIGAVYVPLNPKYPDDKIEFILSDCKPKLILVNSLERIPKDYTENIHIVDDQYSFLSSFSQEKVETKITAHDIAYIIYTSGTTGQPKGVMIRHISLINLTYWYQYFFKVTENDRSSQFASQAFDSFFCETIPFLCLGASVYIIDDHTKLIPTQFFAWLSSQKITVSDLPTAYSQILLDLPWPTDLNLRLLKIGGESLTHYPKQQLSFDIWNGYGPTEATIETTFFQLYQKNTLPNVKNHQHMPPPIGKPIANAEIYVLDQHLEPVPIGDVGELVIGGALISSGYLHRKELTREKFIRNLFSNDPNAKLYRTGDLVRWLDDGNLAFIGRLDHQIKIRGFRIELSEVESNIRKHSDIQEVVVLAKEMITGQKTLVAYLVPNLDKIRIPFHERCLIALSDINYVESMTEDISKEGIALGSFTYKITQGQTLRINFPMPGENQTHWLSGHVVWQHDQRVGIEFDKTPEQKALLEKSIRYYLATHNLMETLRNVSTRRNIRQALKRKLPDYMIPSICTILPQLPLTFNGKIDWKALPPPQDFEHLLERPYVAPRTATEQIITEIWSDILQLKKISITDNFFDLGGNSLLVSQLSVKILEKFHLSVPIKIFIDLPFIPILAEYIDSEGKNSNFKSNIQDEIGHDAILNDDILPIKKFSGNIQKPRGVLLTGAAGFLGIYLLRELLQQTDANIYCIIRKGQYETAAKHLVANIQHYNLSEEISLNNRRIIIIPGDISLDQFGIVAEQYNAIAEKIEVIYHCGAQVNTMASYTNLRSSNVQGTIEIIKFATHKFDKIIHYVSTLSSAYKLDVHNNFVEEFPEADLGNLVGGYAISKWVSERLLTQVKNRGLPISIFRSGYILGQSDTGITNVNDSLLLLIKGCIQLGYAPNWKEKITLLPVDFVSKALVGISLHDPSKSLVYHLDHPRGIMWIDLIGWLNNYGFSIKLCSHEEWRQYLTKITTENALYHFLPYYLAMDTEPVTPGTRIENSKRILKEIGIHFPDISDHLLQLYFNYLCRTGFLPTPQTNKVISI